MSYIRNIILLVLISIFPTSEGIWSITLDTERDIFRAWKLNGGYSYYPTGSQLKILKERIPNDFQFDNFKDARGVWAVIFNSYTTNDVLESPNKSYDIHESNGTISETKAAFTYTSVAQLLTTVSLKYYIQGGAKILIKKNAKEFPFYTISSSSTASYEWVEMSIPFPGSNKIMVEAHVMGKEEFVLIDRIEVFYQETTHPTRRSTTLNTTAAPSTNDVSKCRVFIVLFVIPINLLFINII